MNLKLFSVALSGDSITNGSASGSEFDAGMIYEPRPAVRFGVSVINLLPSSMGGKLTYLNGHTESYPALVKAGAAVKVLGDEDALRFFRSQALTLLLDFDYYPQGQGDPTLYHFGAEWNPHPIITLRAGVDQNLGDDGTGKNKAVSDTTYGVGLNYASFRFDYAYHQFSGLPLDNSYFSISYSPLKKVILGDKVDIFEPQDKLITFDEGTRIRGQVVDPDVKSLEINNNKVVVSKTASFDVEAPLVIGKNKFDVMAYGERGKIRSLFEKKLRILRLEASPDVPEGYWARQQIGLALMLGVVTGYPGGMFEPEGNITRAEMAALLVRAQTSEIETLLTEIGFNDLKRTHWASRFIVAAVDRGIVEGYPDGTYRPEGNITRAEGLAMIARFSKTPQAPYTSRYFPDVAANFWASPIIAGASKAGLLEYLKGKLFEPKKALTRAEAVEILCRTSFVKKMLERDLLNWDAY